MWCLVSEMCLGLKMGTVLGECGSCYCSGNTPVADGTIKLVENDIFYLI